MCALGLTALADKDLHKRPFPVHTLERGSTFPSTRRCGRWLEAAATIRLAVLAIAMHLAPAVSGQVDYCVLEPVLDLGVVIDSSRSIQSSDYAKAIQFIFQVTSNLPISEDEIR